jgi:hypothetical protein
MAIYSLPVQNKVGSYDGDMHVKQYTSLTIGAGNTVTVDQPCRGLMIYVQGDCIINGTLSMTARGAYADPTASGASDANPVSSNGLQMPFITELDTQTLSAAATLFNGAGTAARSLIAQHKSISGNGKIVTFVRQGASGGAGGGSGHGWKIGAVGADGTLGQTGGGAGGTGSYGDPSGFGGTGGAGSYGSCFTGGSGGGDGQYNSQYGGDAQPWGGRGGNAAATNNYDALGGVGNPAGSSAGGGAAVPQLASGTGGLLILVVGGNLTFGPGGRIVSQGSTSSSSGGTPQWRGGSSGGGNILVAYRGSVSSRYTDISIANSSAASKLVTVNTSNPHGLVIGDEVTIVGTAQVGTYRISGVPATGTFTYYADVTDSSSTYVPGSYARLDKISVLGGGGSYVDSMGTKLFGNRGGAGSKQVLKVS